MLRFPLLKGKVCDPAYLVWVSVWHILLNPFALWLLWLLFSELVRIGDQLERIGWKCLGCWYLAATYLHKLVIAALMVSSLWPFYSGMSSTDALYSHWNFCHATGEFSLTDWVSPMVSTTHWRRALSESCLLTNYPCHHPERYTWVGGRQTWLQILVLLLRKVWPRHDPLFKHQIYYL